MRPGPQDITMYQGDDFEFIFRVRAAVLDIDGVTWIPGSYVDLTGYTLLKAQCRLNEASGTVLVEYTCALLTQSGATLGGVIISATKTVVGALTVNASPETLRYGMWDFQMTNTASKQQTYLKGDVFLLPEVTR